MSTRFVCGMLCIVTLQINRNNAVTPTKNIIYTVAPDSNGGVY